jgi:hypothetical protein
MHLDLAAHEELLHQGAVGLVQAGVVQPDAELQRVPQLRILQEMTTFCQANFRTFSTLLPQSRITL